MNQADNVKGKVRLFTGGNTGLGRATRVKTPREAR